MEDPRYPVGPFKSPASPGPPDIRRAIDSIAACPKALRAAVAGLNDDQLDTVYREGGWTVRQVVHHVADSHMNAYIRCKLAVAEDHPRIKAYEQDDWVKFEDARAAPVEVSLALIDALHDRWVRFLRSLPDTAFARTLDHPENGVMTLHGVVFLYEWHGRHHAAHIASLRRRLGWK
jgi:uncharacterized damage-inducible protein DinB